MLFLKMLRDLHENKGQFISIFIMTFMGIFIFTGLNAIGEGMEQSSNKFYKETNLADAYLYGLNFTKPELLQLEKEKAVKNVERRFQIDAVLSNNSKTTIQLNYVENNQISSNYRIEGEAFDSKKEGLWLDSSFAKENDLHVGDPISFLIEGQTTTDTIKGLIMNPEYVYSVKDENEVMPNHKNYGYAFLSSREFSLTDEVPYNQLLIKTDLDKRDLQEVITNVLKEKQTVLLMQKNHPSVNMFQNEIKQMKSIQKVFPFVFLLIAVLTTLTTMTRITANQRTQIGSLKAIGFSNKKILLHYMSYGTFVGIISGVLGLITGPMVLPSITFHFQRNFYSLPEWKGRIEPIIFFITFVCIAGCALSGFFACRKELHGVTAEILRPKPPKAGKHTGIEKCRWWNRLSFDYQWSVRDLLRNKIRSVITIIGIIGCMALIICAFGMRDTVKGVTDTSYKELNTYTTKVSISEGITKETMEKIRADKELQFIQESAIEIQAKNGNETTMLVVISEGNYIKQKDRNNNFIDLPDTGITVTNKLAKLYHLNTGESLKWRIYGTKGWVTAKIENIIRNPVNQGVFVSEKAYTELSQDMFPTAFVTKQTAENFKNKEFTYVQSKNDLLKVMDDLLGTMNVMTMILIIAAVILGMVVLYNLGTLSFHEKVRELSTLKVLGFQHRILRKLLQMQNIWLTLLGTFFGVPTGYLLLAYMLKFMGDSIDMIPCISIISYGISILGTLLLSIVVNWFLSRKLKTIDMVSALKSIE